MTQIIDAETGLEVVQGVEEVVPARTEKEDKPKKPTAAEAILLLEERVAALEGAVTRVVTGFEKVVERLSVAPVAPVTPAPTVTTRVSSGTDVIREWARANGFTVNNHGRLRKDVLEAYARAHGQEVPAPARPAAPAPVEYTTPDGNLENWNKRLSRLAREEGVKRDGETANSLYMKVMAQWEAAKRLEKEGKSPEEVLAILVP